MKRAMTFHFVWCLTSGLDGRALSRALEPACDVPEFGIERLADLAAEIDEAIKQDIGEREALADDEFLARPTRRLRAPRCVPGHKRHSSHDRAPAASRRRSGRGASFSDGLPHIDRTRCPRDPRIPQMRPYRH